MTRLRIDVADLLAHPGTRREVTASDELEGLVGTSATVVGPVTVATSLERVPGGIVVRGEVSARWRAECSTCLREIERDLAVHVDELFEPHPVEGETYPLEGHEIDLEQLGRDSLLLDLPLAPHCDEPCEPSVPIGDARGETDPRWAELDKLEL